MSKVCSKRGCSLPVFVEPRTGIEHDYCGRTHAQQCIRGKLQRPHGRCQTCNMRGCDKTVNYEESTGRVHDFCCKEHAQQAIARGDWDAPLSETAPVVKNNRGGRRLCGLLGCNLPCYVDQKTGRVHDYCGRTHAVEAKNRVNDNRSNISGSCSSSAGVSAPPVPSLRAGLAISSGIAPRSSNTFRAVSASLVKGTRSSLSDSKTSDETNKRRSSSSEEIPVKRVRISTPHTERISSSSAAAPKSPNNTISAPRCTVCLEYNADVLLIPCGHICFCSNDFTQFETLKRQSSSSDSDFTCPICHTEISSKCIVRGLGNK